MPVPNKSEQIKESLLRCLKAGQLSMEQIRARVHGSYDLIKLTLKRNPDLFEMVKESGGKTHSSIWKLTNGEF